MRSSQVPLPSEPFPESPQSGESSPHSGGTLSPPIGRRSGEVEVRWPPNAPASTGMGPSSHRRALRLPAGRAGVRGSGDTRGMDPSCLHNGHCTLYTVATERVWTKMSLPAPAETGGGSALTKKIRRAMPPWRSGDQRQKPPKADSMRLRTPPGAREKEGFTRFTD